MLFLKLIPDDTNVWSRIYVLHHLKYRKVEGASVVYLVSHTEQNASDRNVRYIAQIEHLFCVLRLPTASSSMQPLCEINNIAVVRMNGMNDRRELKMSSR